MSSGKTLMSLAPAYVWVWQDHILDPSAGFVIVRTDGSGAELVKAGILSAESFLFSPV